MGMEICKVCEAICPQVTTCPLTQEVLGQTLRQVVFQLLGLSPALVRTFSAWLVLCVSMLIAQLALAALASMLRLIVARSGTTLRVEAPLTVIVFHPHSSSLQLMKLFGKEGVEAAPLGTRLESVLKLMEGVFWARLPLWAQMEERVRRRIRTSLIIITICYDIQQEDSRFNLKSIKLCNQFWTFQVISTLADTYTLAGGADSLAVKVQRLRLDWQGVQTSLLRSTIFLSPPSFRDARERYWLYLFLASAMAANLAWRSALSWLVRSQTRLLMVTQSLVRLWRKLVSALLPPRVRVSVCEAVEPVMVTGVLEQLQFWLMLMLEVEQLAAGMLLRLNVLRRLLTLTLRLLSATAAVGPSPLAAMLTRITSGLIDTLPLPIIWKVFAVQRLPCARQRDKSEARTDKKRG